MEGRLGRMIKMVTSPFRGEPVDRHFVTAPYYQQGTLCGKEGLEEGMELAIGKCYKTSGELQRGAIIQGFACELVRRTLVPPSEDNPRAARRREGFVFDYVLAEIRRREEAGERVIQEAERVVSKAFSARAEL